MDLRNWELFVATGNPVVGASVSVYEGSLTHPNPNAVIASTTTNADGMWAFTGLSDTAKDVKIVYLGRVKWIKGMTRSSISQAVVIDKLGTISIADGAIVAAKLAADAVETAKIKDLNVTLAKLANDSVDYTKIGILPSAHARGGVNQTINKTTQTSLNLTVETWDTDGLYNNVGTQTNITLVRAGYWLISANVCWNDVAAAAGETRAIVIQLNGTTDLAWSVVPSTSILNTNQQICSLVDAAANDTVRAQVYYDGVPATLNTVAAQGNNWLSAHWIGDT